MPFAIIGDLEIIFALLVKISSVPDGITNLLFSGTIKSFSIIHLPFLIYSSSTLFINLLLSKFDLFFQILKNYQKLLFFSFVFSTGFKIFFVKILFDHLFEYSTLIFLNF